MALQSEMLRDDRRLQACAVHHPSHLTIGTKGDHVGRVQTALFVVDGLRIDPEELKAKHYGTSTANAVLSFKTKRRIINYGYQTRPDNVVGKMTIAALDQELLRKQPLPGQVGDDFCGNDPDVASRPRRASFSPARLAAGGATASPENPAPGEARSVALARTPGAIVAVERTLSQVAQLLAFVRQPSLPIPPGMLREFDAVWRHFGPPKFPKFGPFHPHARGVTSVEEFLATIEKVCRSTLANLRQASTLYREPPEPWHEDAYAFTLGDDRSNQDPPKAGVWAGNGIYLNPGFLFRPELDDRFHPGNRLPASRVGPLKQTEIVIHEATHYPWTQLIQDASGPGLGNCYSYGNYVLHCGFGRETEFDVGQ